MWLPWQPWRMCACTTPRQEDGGLLFGKTTLENERAIWNHGYSSYSKGKPSRNVRECVVMCVCVWWIIIMLFHLYVHQMFDAKTVVFHCVSHRKHISKHVIFVQQLLQSTHHQFAAAKSRVAIETCWIFGWIFPSQVVLGLKLQTWQDATHFDRMNDWAGCEWTHCKAWGIHVAIVCWGR